MRYLAFDTETGGLKPERFDLLTAYFTVLDENLFPFDEGVYLKLKPTIGPIRAEPGALVVNKIDLVKHEVEAITYAEGRSQLERYIERHKQPDAKLTPLGQNVDFDRKFVEMHLMDRTKWATSVGPVPVDTYKIAKRLRDLGKLPGIMNLKLETMINYFNLPRASAHNARNDVIMTVLLLKELRKLEAAT